MSEPTQRNRPDTVRMSAFSSRVAGIAPVPSGQGPHSREMERPRTESYGELWRRANTRLRRF
ncbi:MAG: hypothetical protein M3Y34_01605 [Actinomycetota bacterium]|nr:hypothetical protein [Actinomycetota bacterium]